MFCQSRSDQEENEPHLDADEDVVGKEQSDLGEEEEAEDAPQDADGKGAEDPIPDAPHDADRKGEEDPIPATTDFGERIGYLKGVVTNIVRDPGRDELHCSRVHSARGRRRLVSIRRIRRCINPHPGSRRRFRTHRCRRVRLHRPGCRRRRTRPWRPGLRRRRRLRGICFRRRRVLLQPGTRHRRGHRRPKQRSQRARPRARFRLLLRLQLPPRRAASCGSIVLLVWQADSELKHALHLFDETHGRYSCNSLNSLGGRFTLLRLGIVEKSIPDVITDRSKLFVPAIGQVDYGLMKVCTDIREISEFIQSKLEHYWYCSTSLLRFLLVLCGAWHDQRRVEWISSTTISKAVLVGTYYGGFLSEGDSSAILEAMLFQIWSRKIVFPLAFKLPSCSGIASLKFIEGLLLDIMEDQLLIMIGGSTWYLDLIFLFQGYQNIVYDLISLQWSKEMQDVVFMFLKLQASSGCQFALSPWCITNVRFATPILPSSAIFRVFQKLWWSIVVGAKSAAAVNMYMQADVGLVLVLPVTYGINIQNEHVDLFSVQQMLPPDPDPSVCLQLSNWLVKDKLVNMEMHTILISSSGYSTDVMTRVYALKHKYCLMLVIIIWDPGDPTDINKLTWPFPSVVDKLEYYCCHLFEHNQGKHEIDTSANIVSSFGTELPELCVPGGFKSGQTWDGLLHEALNLLKLLSAQLSICVHQKVQIETFSFFCPMATILGFISGASADLNRMIKYGCVTQFQLVYLFQWELGYSARCASTDDQVLGDHTVQPLLYPGGGVSICGKAGGSSAVIGVDLWWDGVLWDPGDVRARLGGKPFLSGRECQESGQWATG